MTLKAPVWKNATLGFGDPSISTPPLNYNPSADAHLILFFKGPGVPNIDGYTLADSHVGGDGYTYSLWFTFVPWYQKPHAISVTQSGNWHFLATAVSRLNKRQPIIGTSWGSNTAVAPVIQTPGLPKRTSQLFYGSVSGATPPQVVGGDVSGHSTHQTPLTGSIALYMPGADDELSDWNLAIETGQSITWDTTLSTALTVELAVRNDDPFEGQSGTPLGGTEPRVVPGSLTQTPFDGNIDLDYIETIASGCELDANRAVFVTNSSLATNYVSGRATTMDHRISVQVINISSGKPVQEVSTSALIMQLDRLGGTYVYGNDVAFDHNTVPCRIGRVVKAPDGTLLVPYKIIYRQTAQTLRTSFVDLNDWHGYLQSMSEPFAEIGVIPLTWNGSSLTIHSPVSIHHYTFADSYQKGHFNNTGAPAIAITRSNTVILSASEPFIGMDGWYTHNGTNFTTTQLPFNQTYQKQLVLDTLSVNGASISSTSSVTTNDVATGNIYFHIGAAIGPSSAAFVTMPQSTTSGNQTLHIVDDSLVTTGAQTLTASLGNFHYRTVRDLVPAHDNPNKVIYTGGCKYVTINLNGTVDTLRQIEAAPTSGSGQTQVPNITSDGYWLLPADYQNNFELFTFIDARCYSPPVKVVDTIFAGGTFPSTLSTVLLQDRYAVVLCCEAGNETYGVVASYMIDIRQPRATKPSAPSGYTTSQPTIMPSNSLHITFPQQNAGTLYSLGLPYDFMPITIQLDSTHVAYITTYGVDANGGTPSVTRDWGLQASIVSVNASGAVSSAGSATSGNIFSFDTNRAKDGINMKMYLRLGIAADLGTGLFAVPYLYMGYYGTSYPSLKSPSYYEAGVIQFSWDGTSLTFYAPSPVRSHNNTLDVESNKQASYTPAPAIAVLNDGTVLFGGVNPDSYYVDPLTNEMSSRSLPFLVDKLSVDRTGHTVSSVGNLAVPVTEWVIGWNAVATALGTTAYFAFSNRYFGVDKNLNLLVPERFDPGASHAQYDLLGHGFINMPGKDYALQVHMYWDTPFTFGISPLYSNGTSGIPKYYTGTGINWQYPFLPPAATTDGMVVLPTVAHQYSGDDGFGGGYDYDNWPYHQLHVYNDDGIVPLDAPKQVANDIVSNKTAYDTADDLSSIIMHDRYQVIFQVSNSNQYFSTDLSGDIYVIDIRG